jgi:large subunit ribosomal protein L25
MAEQLSLSAEKRELLGTRVARRYRAAGKIPAVLARKGEEPVHLLVDAREFGRLMKKHARIINLTHPAGKDKVFLKEVQYDHLDENAVHIDFTRIAMDQVLTLEVPLLLKGKPAGVVESGGVLDQFVKVLKIQCLPDAIPDAVEIDVTALKMDAGLKAAHDADLVLAIVQEHKVEEVVAATGAAAATEPEVIKKEKAAEEGAEGEKKEAPKKEAAKKEDKK